ncbi:MAG: hypothetical protein KatS3mg054_0620 [Chloroflexus sp.]|nr:MAG: hypothetical protein KatS3mg054_0620 [Chloroflexus sp.]
MNEAELKQWREAIAHKAYKLTSDDIHPVLRLYVAQDDWRVLLEKAKSDLREHLATGYRGYLDKQRAAAEDLMYIAELRREYIRARRKFLRALRDQEALDKDTEDTLESVRPPFC